MATTQTRFSIGSISTGTLLTEDLLEAFSSELERLDPSNLLLMEVSKLLGTGADSLDDDQEEQAGYLLDEITDALNALCPPFVSFGAHPGDGADFGFWPDHNGLEDALMYGEFTGEEDTKFLPEDGVYVHISDHGNIAVYDKDRNLLWDCV